MESRFRVLNQRFDSLWADSLLVPMPMRRQFLKALHTASRVRDSAKAHLSELRIIGEESNPAKWESIQKKSQRSLDGLHRFFLDAESILQVDLENDPDPGGLIILPFKRHHPPDQGTETVGRMDPDDPGTRSPDPYARRPVKAG